MAGTVVTIDAMGCQRAIAEKIVGKKADYILAVKENQGHLLEEIKDSFRMLAADAVAEEIDCGHGRVEQRRCSVIADLGLIEKAAEWPSLQGLVRIEAERYHKATGKIEREIRYYITSLKPDAARLNRADSPALGHRKQTALGARCRLRRRPQPQTRRPRRAELLPAQPHRSQHAQAGENQQTRDQGKTPQCRLGPPLPTQTARSLICVKGAINEHRTSRTEEL